MIEIFETPIFERDTGKLGNPGANAHTSDFSAKPSCAFGSGSAGPGPMPPSDPTSLFDAGGRRKYLNADERERFVAAAATFTVRIEALCLLLHFTGCRISEALAVRPQHLEPGADTVILQTLKQRRRGVFRMLPLPSPVMQKLRRCQSAEEAPLFGWHRSTAWEKIKGVMGKAGIKGPHANSRGTRHGFGVAAVSAGVPITLVQRWLGHARLETTAIYLAVTGLEERDFASRLWRKTNLIRTRQETCV